MKKNEIQALLQDVTEEQAPAAQIDLWPALQSRLPLSQPSSMKGTLMKPQKSFRRGWAAPFALLAALAVLAALFFVQPQGRALAQQALQFFTRGETNLWPGPTPTAVRWVEQTPGAAAPTRTPPPPQPTQPGPAYEKACGSLQNAHCSVEAIRALAPFPVYALAQIPDGLVFAGATGGPERVTLHYTSPKQTGSLTLWMEPYHGADALLAGEVGADAQIESVAVGAAVGEYVRGSYNGNFNSPVWDATLPDQTLRWADHGLFFTLFQDGSEPRLERDDLAALAAALTDGPVGASGQPVIASPTPTAPADPRSTEEAQMRSTYPLTLAEAEAKAGFKLLTPTRLPEPLSFFGAVYNETTHTVRMLYQYDDPLRDPTISAPDGLVIDEQPAPAASDCDLCGFVQGNGKQVEQYPIGKLISDTATIETVQIHGAPASYVEGIGWVSRQVDTGWQWDATPYIKRLRFRTDALAVALAYYGFTLDRAGLLDIAQAMQ
jgi:hypothetical protein